MAQKVFCSNLGCRHHQHGDICGTEMRIGSGAKCLSFEKGLAYYFDLVWQALSTTNFIDVINLNADLRIGLYCVMTAYHLGFSEMEWGTCRMVGLKAGENSPLLKASDIRAMSIDPEQVHMLAQALESGTLPHPKSHSTQERCPQPFGWLSPTGNFTEGDFGEHEAVANKIIQQVGLDPEYRAWRTARSGTCRDFLSEVKGYCLIHNPSGSGGYIVSYVKPLTKKQRDFLFGYFMEIGDRFKAEQFVDADE